MSGLLNNSLFLSTAAAAAGGYQIERSLRFNSADSAYLSRTPAVAGNRRTWTWAGWVKRSAISGEVPLFHTPGNSNSTYFRIYITSDQLSFTTLNFSGGIACGGVTTQVFRDPSSWMHFVVAFDTTQATASDRLKLYVNGSQVTQFSSSNWPTQNTDYGINTSGLIHYIGLRTDATLYADGYLADVHFIDGQALTPSSFTEVSATTGQLIPKAYTGTYTGNSFWLKFNDNSAATATTLGKDSFLLGNNWTPNNLSVTAGAGNDSLVDTPTSYGTDTGAGGEVRGNYCTLNPLDSGGGTVSNGNLEHTFSSSNTRIRSTISIPETGKWYAEFVASNTGGGNSLVGVSIGTNALTGTNWYLGNDAGSWGCQIGSGTMYTYNAGGFSSFGTAASGDVIAVAVDRAAGKIWWAVNNTWIGSGDPANGTNARYTNIPSTGTLFFAISNASNSSIVCNFGQRAFAYTAPSGFKALVDTNLGAPVVAKPNTVMDVVLYTGNSSARSITGFSFSPDFVWIKPRSVATQHNLYDAVRGATKALFSDFTDAEATVSNGLTAFNNDGFSLGSNQYVNNNAVTFVAWTWDAGSSTDPNNTAGSITSQVRANASAGFSIVSYTAAYTGSARTVGHGLGVKPSLIILKNRSDGSANWRVYHSASGASLPLILNSTAAASANIGIWNNTEPTSSVFTIGVNTDVGGNIGSGEGLIAYCFAPVVGYSSFGSYTGNGSADGPFVYTGFRPRWILTKRYDGGANGWGMFDALRPGYNLTDSFLQAQSSGTEATGATAYSIDILSNGFKVKGTDAFVNQSGGSYIYAAFAESPFQYARAR